MSGSDNIAAMWGTHFEQLLNSVDVDEVYMNETKDKILNSAAAASATIVSPDEVRRAIRDLKKGSAAGPDGLSAEHFIYAPEQICVILSHMLSLCLTHGHLPDLMMKSFIVPLVKNKLGVLSDINNYRGIAISSVISKIFESTLLIKCEDKLWSSDIQFGFKAGSSTHHATFLLTEVLNYYRRNSSNVYSCFVDATKAFDRVNYWKLFNKLLLRGVDPNIVRILAFWYTNQTMSVKWNNCFSASFYVRNGVRQGGKMSPFLFNVYVDDLLVAVHNVNAGCAIKGLLYNIIAFADDIVLFAPSVAGLRRLIDCCVSEAKELDIKFNPSKSKCMLFPTSDKRFSLKGAPNPVILLDGSPLKFVDEFPYLGHVMTPDLSDAKDIVRARRSLCKQGNMIIHKFRKASGAVKLCLFRSFCLGLFGCELWDNSNANSLREISVMYHNIIKQIVDVPRHSHNHIICHDFRLLTFDKLIASRQLNFLLNLKKSRNNLITNIFHSIYPETKLYSSVNWIFNTFELNNLDLNQVNKWDIKRIFRCIVTCVAMNQYETIYNNFDND